MLPYSGQGQTHTKRRSPRVTALCQKTTGIDAHRKNRHRQQGGRGCHGEEAAGRPRMALQSGLCPFEDQVLFCLQAISQQGILRGPPGGPVWAVEQEGDGAGCGALWDMLYKKKEFCYPPRLYTDP